MSFSQNDSRKFLESVILNISKTCKSSRPVMDKIDYIKDLLLTVDIVQSDTKKNPKKKNTKKRKLKEGEEEEEEEETKNTST